MKKYTHKLIIIFLFLLTSSYGTALASINLESNVTTLNVGEKAKLSVMATYSDGSSKELNENIEFIITPTDSVEVNGTVLTAKKDGNVTVQAKAGSILSSILTLNITWVVNGHTLPSEPDKTLNDSTLLGIDINNNGVRDDVERWIYEEYKDKHPIHIDIGMQAARGYKLILDTPTERAREIMEFVEAPLYCELYYRSCVDDVKEKRIIHEDEEVNSKYFREVKYFNTIQRMEKYLEYDMQFSGDSYTLIRCSQRKKLCDFNTSQYED